MTRSISLNANERSEVKYTHPDLACLIKDSIQKFSWQNIKKEEDSQRLNGYSDETKVCRDLGLSCSP